MFYLYWRFFLKQATCGRLLLQFRLFTFSTDLEDISTQKSTLFGYENQTELKTFSFIGNDKVFKFLKMELCF